MRRIERGFRDVFGLQTNLIAVCRGIALLGVSVCWLARAHAAEVNPYHAGLKAEFRGDNAAAIRHFTEAIALNLNRLNAHLHRGRAYARANNPAAAQEDFNAATKLEPRKALPWRLLAEALVTARDYRGAVVAWEHALPLQPRDGTVQNSLAWVLATCPEAGVRNGKRAITLAQQACQIRNWRDSHALDTLAAAYAETGNFEEALRWQTEAVAVLDKYGPVSDNMRRAIRANLKRIRAREPIRETPP